jgi:hypothetical protein
MTEGYEERHSYPHSFDTEAGEDERIDYLLARLWFKHGGNLAKIRGRLRRAMRKLEQVDHNQYLQGALIEQLKAMPEGERTPYKLASRMTQQAGGDDHMHDRLRQQIKRALDAEKQGLASGTWNPNPLQITSGSSVNWPPDKPKQNR